MSDDHLTRATLQAAIDRIREARVPSGPCSGGGLHVVHPRDYARGGWVRCANCSGLIEIEPNPSKETAVPRFRKKPVVIEAELWDGTVPEATRVIDWVLAGGGTARYHEPVAAEPAYLAIDTLEGTMKASAGDYVIRGVKGEHYPCKPDVFAATYDPEPEA